MTQSNQQNIKNIRTSKQTSGDKKPPSKKMVAGLGLGLVRRVYVLAQTTDLALLVHGCGMHFYADTYCTGAYNYVCHRLLH